MNVKLSIVMPIFNRKDLVRIMIDSIIANTYQDWELLAIDDGSTDGTFDMLQKYAQKDMRIKPYLRIEQPKGAQTCRNIGLEKALGEYIIFFDSDDYITPTCLETRVSKIKLQQTVDFLVFPMGIFEKQCDNFNMLWGVESNKQADMSLFIMRENLPFVVATNIYKREALLKHNIVWDTNIQSLQDSQFNISVLLNDMKYEYVPLARADYLYRRGTTTNSVAKKIFGTGHAKSHLYLLDDTYKKVTAKKGTLYNYALFVCALYITHRLTYNDRDTEMLNNIISIVKKYDSCRGFFLTLIIYSFLLLSAFLPNNLSHRIVFAPYTIMQLLRKKYRSNKLKHAFL